MEPLLDLAVLEIFRTVASERSVTRAAERMQRAQSNVTTRIRQLEDDLGAALFLRDGKRMTLTPEGETLLAYANRLLSLAEEARQAISPGKPGGRLRIGTMESTAASRLPAPLARFHTLWPSVEVTLATGPTDELAERVLAHELDCAFVAQPPGQDGLAPGLEGVRVFTEELLLVLPAGHPEPRSAADLKVETLAAFETGCTYRRLAEAWLEKGRERPLKLLELSSYHAILACVAAGNSIGIVPRSVLEVHRPALALRTQPLTRVDTMLVRRRGYRSAAYEAFLEILADPAAP